jgi:hypothetical protein
LLDAGAELAPVQKMVAHESVTTAAGYDRCGDAARRKAADLVHVLFSRGRPEPAAGELIAASHPAENQHHRTVRPQITSVTSLLVFHSIFTHYVFAFRP